MACLEYRRGNGSSPNMNLNCGAVPDVSSLQEQVKLVQEKSMKSYYI